MKSKLKRVLVLLLAVAVAVPFGFFSQSSDKEGERLKAEYQEFLRVAGIQGEKMSSIDAFKARYSEDEYAGLYFTDEKLTICLLGSDRKREQKADFIKSLDGDIEILIFKYSEAELNKELEKIYPFFDGDRYYAASTDPKQNALVIETKADLTYEEVKKECGIGLDEEHVVFEHIHPDAETVTTTYINSGTTALANGNMFTIGFGGEAGASYLFCKFYLIPGHAVSLADYVKYGTGSYDWLGKVVYSSFGGNLDFAIVERYDSSMQLYETLPYDPLYGSVPIPYGSGVVTANIGQYLITQGITSGLQFGTVVKINQSGTASGVAYSQMLKCTYRAVGGDSGAPVFTPSGSSNPGIVGMQSSSSLVNGVWDPNTSYSVCAQIRFLNIGGGTYGGF